MCPAKLLFTTHTHTANAQKKTLIAFVKHGTRKLSISASISVYMDGIFSVTPATAVFVASLFSDVAGES